VPEELAAAADRLARDLGVSRNDGLLRLAARGARLYEQEQRIAERRAERLAAIYSGDGTEGTDFLTSDEAQEAVMSGRDE